MSSRIGDDYVGDIDMFEGITVESVGLKGSKGRCWDRALQNDNFGEVLECAKIADRQTRIERQVCTESPPQCYSNHTKSRRNQNDDYKQNRQKTKICPKRFHLLGKLDWEETGTQR